VSDWSRWSSLLTSSLKKGASGSIFLNTSTEVSTLSADGAMLSPKSLILKVSLPRRCFYWYILICMSAMISVPQHSSSHQRFVDQSPTYQADASGPDPELKKILPMVFESVGSDIVSQSQHDAEFFAPLFVDNSKGTIQKSVSTQKVSPIAPEDLIGISSYYSSFHPGIDYRAKLDTPIRAILPGIVNEVGYERGGYGNYIILVHHVDGKTLFSLYAHMRMPKMIAGDQVDVGDKIGEVGLTGRTTGPHLHFELHDTSRAMNPLKFFTTNNIAMVNR
jgi:murein DD-endopeptidase MepM/ murein hydrolase activator NlpD